MVASPARASGQGDLFAVRLLTRGVPITVVSELLGHSDINLTAKRYGRFSSDAKVKWDVVKEDDPPAREPAKDEVRVNGNGFGLNIQVGGGPRVVERHETSVRTDTTRSGGNQAVGGACRAHGDCGTGLCVNRGGVGYCTRSCTGILECPTFWHCGPVQGITQKVCFQL